jgi:uncharacterized membrane protein
MCAAMNLRHLSFALFTALALPVCDSSDDDEHGDGPNVDCAAVTTPKFSEMTAWTKCTACHSSSLAAGSRAGAPPGIDFDTYAAAKANAQTAMDEVFHGDMPLPGSPALSEDEKNQIYNWASCDTPN